MALTSEELTALDTITGEIAQIAIGLYAALLQARHTSPGAPGFTREQAFELTKVLTTYAVNETDQ